MSSNNSINAPFLFTMTDGQLLIGSTGANPVPTSVSAGSGISLTAGAGTLAISAPTALSIVNQTTNSVTMTTNTRYISNAGASVITFTLPTSSAVGDKLEVVGAGSGLWTIAQASGQQVKFLAVSTSLGVLGGITSTAQYSSIEMVCIIANTIWSITGSVGSVFTIV